MAISKAVATNEMSELVMAAATALTSAPFLRHNYRRCCVFLPAVAASAQRGRVINKLHSSIPNAAKFTHSQFPICPVANGKPASFARIRNTSQFLCYCTETEAQNGNPASSTTSDGGDAVREAANTLDIRVGKIIKAWRHEEADSLYIEEVDVGEPETRTICSGLVKYIPLHLLQDRNVVVLANLKPRNMCGIKSFGMLMAASDAAHENVELLVPPEGAVPGDRIWFGSVDEKENLPDVASPNQVQKKKIWEQVQPLLRTDGSCVAKLGPNHQMRTSAGPIISPSLRNANIS